MNETPVPPAGPDADPDHFPVTPPAPPNLSTARAARMLEVALTTPDGMPGDVRSMLWKPPTVETLRSWVPEYEVEKRVARGSSGWVYVARHQLLDRRVALKVLAPAEPGTEEETARLRADEGRLIAQLSHPNVLRVYDSRPLPEGQHLFIFEYADGGSLRQRLTEGALPRAKALALGEGIAAGLAHAHASGIIHRDLKPENILFQEASTPLIGDFGSAVRPAEEAAPEPSCGTTGTPHYRAPEQVSGGPLGPAVDLYALGIILHEMLTGSLPEGTSTVLPPVVDPALPADLRALLSGLMQPDPARRGPDAAELARRLRAMRPGMARRKWLTTGGAAAALTAMGGLAFLVRKKPRPEAPSPVPPIVYPSGGIARQAVLRILRDFRALESQGDWESSNRYYGDRVYYFTGTPMPHLEVVKIRAGNAQKFRNFRTLLLETPDFPPAPPPQLGVRALYWCTTEAADGSFRLGTVKEDMVFQPRVSGDPLWQIVRHQNKEESNVWSSTAGRTLDAAAATELLDRFLKVEQTGTISEQLPWYAPWSRYYSTGWAAHRLIRQQMELRSAKRPGFRCERRGEVTVQPGSHLRWLVEAPCYSFPVSDVLPESERVRVRSFIFSPLEADKWLIIAEATMLSGQAAFDQFWKDGNGALPVIGTEVRTGNSGQ